MAATRNLSLSLSFKLNVATLVKWFIEADWILLITYVLFGKIWFACWWDSRVRGHNKIWEFKNCYYWQNSILVVGGIVSESERWRQGQFWQVGFLLSSSTTQRPARSKQANKQRWQKNSKKWASCFPALPPNGLHRADIFLANLKIAHFRPFMGRLCLLKWPQTSKWWTAEIRFLGFSYITSHLI